MLQTLYNRTANLQSTAGLATNVASAVMAWHGFTSMLEAQSELCCCGVICHYGLWCALFTIWLSGNELIFNDKVTP